jgi:hypothetical protein
MRPVGPRRLADEHELGPKGLGDIAHEPAQELLADRAGGPLRDRPQQLTAAKARRAIVDGC